MTAVEYVASVIAPAAAVVLVGAYVWPGYMRRVKKWRRTAATNHGMLMDVMGWGCTGDHPHAVYDAQAPSAPAVRLCLTTANQDAIAHALASHRAPNGTPAPAETFGNSDLGALYLWGGTLSGFQVHVPDSVANQLRYLGEVPHVVLTHRCGEEFTVPDGDYLGNAIWGGVVKHREAGCLP